MKKTIGILAFFAVMLGFGVAYAQGALPSPDSDIGGFFIFLYEKLKSAEWMMMFGGALVLVVFLVRKLLAAHVEWFSSKLGGYAVSLLTALGLAMGTALMAGKPVEMNLVMTALSASFMAAGGWEAVRDILTHLGKDKTE